MYALVDCNNFYVACEQLFRPDLRGKPTVVLSNNDGCVVSRSAEAKALGISMAVPVFQIRELIRTHQVAVFSSNYALYADISARVMDTLTQLTPEIEVYSIDEAFLMLAGFKPPDSWLAYGQEVQALVKQYVGIEVGVGIAPTKTLAKLANYAAKRYKATGGVVDLTSQQRQQRLLAITPASEVWGVGQRLAAQLLDRQIHTAADLAQAHKPTLRQGFSVVLERTARELAGEACLQDEQLPMPRQQIICSRSFARPIAQRSALQAALNALLARAAERLRAEQLCTQRLIIFAHVRSDRSLSGAQHHSLTAELIEPSQDTRVLFKQAKQLLQQLWHADQRYVKAGVALLQLSPQGMQQYNLLVQEGTSDKDRALMQVMDEINSSGKGSIRLGSQTKSIHELMRQAHKSPAYTTHWQQLPRVY